MAKNNQIHRIIALFFLFLPTFVQAQGVIGENGDRDMERPKVQCPIFHHDGIQTRKATQKVGEINLAPRGVLILVQFSDKKFAAENTHAAFEDFANGSNYNYRNAVGSCKNYFTTQSNGSYSPTFDVVGPVTLSKSCAYYGGDSGGSRDQNIADFVIEAVEKADALGVDFSKYDNDDDGAIDFVYLLYAGGGQADGGSASTIWPHNWDVGSALYYGYTSQTEYYYNHENDYNLPVLDGKTLWSYSCSPELRKNQYRTSVGTFLHEFSHVLGLPDYYLTSASPTMGEETTPGAWSIMASGNYLNEGNCPGNYSVYDKFYLGFTTPEILSWSKQVAMFADGKNYYMITRDGKMPDTKACTPDTIYYLENRQYTGWDAYLPGHGMVIWQVVWDKDRWQTNTPNDFSTRYTIITANGSEPNATEHKAGEYQTFPGKSGRYTRIKLFDYWLEDIKENNGLITFHFSNPLSDINEVVTKEETITTKTIEDGRIVIIKNGRKYDIMGRCL